MSYVSRLLNMFHYHLIFSFSMFNLELKSQSIQNKVKIYLLFSSSLCAYFVLGLFDYQI